MLNLRQSIENKVKLFDEAIVSAKSDKIALEIQRDKKRFLCQNDLYYLCCLTGNEQIAKYPDYYKPFCDEVSLMNWQIVFLGMHRKNDYMLGILEVSDDPQKDLVMQRLYLCYRSFYKTTIITKIHSLQLLLNFPNIHICLAHNKQENSSDNLVSVKSCFLTTALKYLYPDYIPNTKEWGNMSGFSVACRTDKNRSEENIEAVGVDTEITGRHYQVAKKNDLVTEKSVNTEEQIKKTLDWDNRFNQGMFDDPQRTLQDYEGTRYHFADLYSVKINDPRLKIIDYPLLKDKNISNLSADNISNPKRFSVEGVKDMMKDMWVFNCFTEDTKILTTSGTKRINEIYEGCEVISHTGNINKVLNIGRIKTLSPIWKIYLYGLPEPIKCTGNHPLMTYPLIKYRGSKITQNNVSEKLTGCGNNPVAILKKVETEIADWLRADELKVFDALVSPVGEIKEHKITDKYFWWFVGFYLAEGCLNYSNNTIVIACSKKEIKYLKRIIKILKVTSKIYENKSTLSLSISNREIFNFLIKFGRYAFGKFLPYDIECLPRKQALSLAAGYFAGDGYTVRNRKAINSVSVELLLGMRRLLIKHNIIGYIQKIYDDKISFIQGRKVNCRALYGLFFYKNVKKTWIYEGNLYTRIRKIEIDEQSTPINVYNFEVENDHSYCLNGVVAKNCQMLLRPDDPAKMQFKREMIGYFSHVPEDSNFYLLVDPASRRKKKSDWTVMLIVGLSWFEGRLRKFIVDGIRDKLDPRQRVDMAISLVKKWSVKGCGWESIGFQETDCFYLEEVRRKERLFFTLEEISSHQAAKEDRIRSLIPEYSQHDWLWPQRGLISAINFEGRAYDLTADMEYEMLQFPLCEHDDLLDTMTFINRINTVKPKEIKTTPDIEGMTFGEYTSIRDNRIKEFNRNPWNRLKTGAAV